MIGSTCHMYAENYIDGFGRIVYKWLTDYFFFPKTFLRSIDLA